MAWTKNPPKTGLKIAEILGDLVNSLEDLQTSHTEYADNAAGRNDHRAKDKHEEILDILDDAITHLAEAKERLEEWPSTE